MYEPVITTFKREADSAYIRRLVKLLCLKIGFSTPSIDSILLTLTELLTNVSKHAHNYAEVISRPLLRNGRIEGIEVMVKDKGPGIEDVNQALIDGYSTAGSLGLGLGAVLRLSDSYSIETFHESKFSSTGTQIRFQKLLKSKPYNPQLTTVPTRLVHTPNRWNVDGFSERRDGSRYNGDGIYWNNTDHSIFAAVIDGVGHGYDAYEATQLAMRIIKTTQNLPLENIMKKLHSALLNTVGCQVALARIDKLNRTGTYLIVGNIRGFILSSSSVKTLLSKDGTVGRHLPTLIHQDLNFESLNTLVFHSDGISRVWISTIKKSNFSIDLSIGGEVLRKHRKTRDDCSYILIRNR